MSAMQRNKGRAFEQLVARMLTGATGIQWRRIVRNIKGEDDVAADAPELRHIVVECKHANTLCLPEWWRQAQDQAARSLHGPVRIDGELRVLPGVPVLVYRKTRGAIQVQLDAHNVNPATWPVPGRYVVTLDWEPFTQWLREQIPLLTTYTLESLAEKAAQMETA